MQFNFYKLQKTRLRYNRRIMIKTKWKFCAFHEIIILKELLCFSALANIWLGWLVYFIILVQVLKRGIKISLKKDFQLKLLEKQSLSYRSFLITIGGDVKAQFRLNRLVQGRAPHLLSTLNPISWYSSFDIQNSSLFLFKPASTAPPIKTMSCEA